MTTTDAVIALICEEWTMELRQPRANAADPHEEWFLDWVLRSPGHAGRHLTAGWLAAQELARVVPASGVHSAREYFGGMGAQSLFIRKLWAPTHHTVMDYSAQATQHLRRVLAPEVNVERADAYDPSSCVPAEIVALDFGDLTVWKTREGELHRKLLDRVFAHRPAGVLLTDISARYLHLHRERYETLLGEGTCGSYEDYLDALVRRLGELYGYRLVGGFMDRWSTVMALVPGSEPSVPFVETPGDPVGLELF